jgi:ribonucleoside-diphosphate reductase alpha chain
VKVEKRDKRIVDFDESKIEAAIRKAFEAGNEDTGPVRGITKEVVQIIHEREKDVITIEDIQDIVEDTLMLRGFTNIARRYMKYREWRHEARRILQMVGVVDDLKFGPNAATVLKRYLLKDERNNPVETPSQLFRRVSSAVASVETKFDKNTNVQEYDDLFYYMMTSLEFLPNSPTLFNAGTNLGQCSACFVLPIDDDMTSIFTSLKDMAIVQKSGGGCIKEGTKVLTKEHGLIPIDQIPGFKEIKKIGEPQTIPPVTLYSWNPVLKTFEERTVQDGWKFRLNRIARIRYGSNGNIETSCWHPFFVWDNGRVVLKRADELVEGDWLLKNGIHDIPISETDSSYWWLIGYILADGCFDKTVNGLRLRLFDSRREILERANKIIARYRGTRELKLQRDSREDCYVLATSSKNDDSFLSELYRIVGEKKLVPTFDPEAPYSFLAGLLDGDGFFGRDVISLYTSSTELKDFVGSQLARLGINYKVRERERERFGQLSQGWEVAFSVGYGRLFPTVRSPRLSKYKPFSFRKIRVQEISVIEEDSTLYDFTVPISQNYLAGNGHLTVVHNTGFSFSRLRPKGSRVGTTGGVASGPVSFMRVYDTATDVIKQGGRRRGANMAILRCDHPDIMEFISCKSDKQSFRNFNISVAVTDKFITALKNDDEIELIHPHTKEAVKRIRARAIFDAIVHNAWNTGDPGVIFIDRINKEHTLKGELIEATNPCVAGDTLVSTEIGLLNIREIPNAIKTAKKMIYLLQTKEGYQVKLTKDHRILTPDGWKQASSLVKGDKIRLQETKGGFGDRGSLRVGQIMGWYMSDGWNTGKDQRATLAFYGKDKGKIVEYYRDIVNEELKSNLVIIKSRNREEVRSRKILKLIQEWEMESKQISNQLMKSSMACQRGFLQGLFSADGSVQGTARKGFTVRLSQNNLENLHKCQIMLLNFGIASKIYENRRSEQMRVMPDGNGKSRLYRVKSNHELVVSKENIIGFRDKIGFLLEYKQSRLVKNIESSKTRGPYKEDFLVRFESLEPLQEEDVFDIVGTPNSGFIANGIVVHNCGEQPLLPYESCVLGSINLSRMIKDGEINWERLEDIVRLAVRFLDNIIDLNVYPVSQIGHVTKANRKIGLGIMGFAEFLIKLGIPYDSLEGLEKAEEVMSFIRKKAERASSDLAKNRGNFENFASLKKRNTWKRNATLITIAPTGSIGLIAQTSSGIEPLFAVAHSRILAEGINLSEVNPLFKEIAEERGIWTDELEQQIVRTGSVQDIESVPEDMKRLFKSAHEIDPTWHVKMQAAFQKHTDNAVSKTANLPNHSTTEDVEQIFLLADELHLKGITVFRDGCLDGVQVLYTGCPNCETL